MSVQCKNCANCQLEVKECSLHFHERYKRTKHLKVNLTRQRMCAEFIRRGVK